MGKSAGRFRNAGWRRQTHEQVIRIRGTPANAKQLHQIVKLPMDVTAYLRSVCAAREVSLCYNPI
jgi:hypothetical protein